ELQHGIVVGGHGGRERELGKKEAAVWSARLLYSYIGDISGVKKRRQPLCRKGLSVICLKMVLEVLCREWSQKKATHATALTVRGCDHL
ncbi:hypothetical protein, partial [Klebsiella pneumoniae]|uniref:hypothetical protein n=1 Tax=Klebsiella pneumoniae TaxID=573 RepID=UPI001C12B7DD